MLFFQENNLKKINLALITSCKTVSLIKCWWVCVELKHIAHSSNNEQLCSQGPDSHGLYQADHTPVFSLPHYQIGTLLLSTYQILGTRHKVQEIWRSMCLYSWPSGKFVWKQSMKIMRSPRIQNSYLSFRVYTYQQCEFGNATKISQYLLLSNSHKPHFSAS